MPPLVIIASVARNGIIGRDNHLIWRLKSDMKHFRAMTLGKPVIMGRKTYDSIGKPLPGRQTIVLTRKQLLREPGVEIAHSIDHALSLGGMAAVHMGASEVMVAGGAEVYRAFMPRAVRLEITEVEMEPDGDVVFPKISSAEWKEVARQSRPSGPDDEAAFSFVTYERR